MGTIYRFLEVSEIKVAAWTFFEIERIEDAVRLKEDDHVSRVCRRVFRM